MRLKKKLMNVFDVYLLEIQDKQTKPNPVRAQQISKMIQWTHTCDEDILVSRLERELKLWPMAYKLLGSHEKSKSQLWRDLRSCLDAYYSDKKEHSGMMQQERYERYEEKMTGLIRYMRDIHQEQMDQVNDIHQERLKATVQEKNTLEKELDALKSSGHVMGGISW